MEISVVILSEEEVRQAVALWLKMRMTPAPAVVSQVKPVRHKRQALVYAVSVQCVDAVDGVDDVAVEGFLPPRGSRETNPFTPEDAHPNASRYPVAEEG